MLQLNEFGIKTGLLTDEQISISGQLRITTVNVKNKGLVSLHGDVCWCFKGKAILYVYEEQNEVSLISHEPPESVAQLLLKASIKLPC